MLRFSSIHLATPEQEFRKQSGSFYTPPDVVQSLVSWAVRQPSDRMLDPSCGDGRFLAAHDRSVGVEQDPSAYSLACQRAPWALIHEGEFFEWAATTKERFECAAGNPPFIRYQRFAGATRQRALRLCASVGATFSALASSWAPFLVATASLLKKGGRMAFVIPSEVGHATYAEPLLRYCMAHFGRVQLVAVREKIFAELSEDVWLLFAEEFGKTSDCVELSTVDRVTFSPRPPKATERISTLDWERWNKRLRPFLLPRDVRDLYRHMSDRSPHLSSVAKVGIGYVTGANDFFHLKPSFAKAIGIPRNVLRPAVRNGRALTGKSVTRTTVARWIEGDEPVLLLNLKARTSLTKQIRTYLDSPAGREARQTYKCRNRSPWYVVPDVTEPDAFLAYMSGDAPAIVANRARCVGTNSVHTVRLNGSWSLQKLQRAWNDPFTALSCEVEGHPLGGGALKIEPGEAGRIVLAAARRWSPGEASAIRDGIEAMRRWRHLCGQETQAS